jgi:hypothetical protein
MNIGLKGYFDNFAFQNRKTGDRIPATGMPTSKVNLITDAGLDMPATNTWYGCFQYMMIGTGSTPATYADTALEAQIASSNTYSGTENGRTYSVEAKTVTLWTTFIIPGSESDPTVFREMSVGPDGTAAFNRIVLLANVTIPAGYDLVARYNIVLTIASWMTPFDLTMIFGVVPAQGKFMSLSEVAHPEYILDEISSSRISPGNHGLEPSTTTNESFDSIRPFTTQPSVLSSSTTYGELELCCGTTSYQWSISTYAAGTHYRDRVYTIQADDYSQEALYGFYVRYGYLDGTSYYRRFFFVFRSAAGFIKPAAETWTVTERISWGRSE